MSEPSAFLLAGTSSGSGKTTICLGLLAALSARGLAVQPFKCGPDFIDPSLHRMVTGKISSNLDLRMCGKDFCHEVFTRQTLGCDVALVEGVMGLYDGGEASSASLAIELGLPVVLVVDSRSAAESVAAVVKGFETYSSVLTIAGIIFNGVGSARHRELIEKGMAGNCASRILGFFPRDASFTIPDRHLGLHMGEENPLSKDGLDRLVLMIEEHVDLDLLLSLTRGGRSRKVRSGQRYNEKQQKSLPVKLAVARDRAFCFYYQDNLRILEDMGVNLVFFSPLQDICLPKGCDGIYFGGGYPELFAGELAANLTMLESVRSFAERDGLIYGECGGFMYLCRTIADLQGDEYGMSGVFPFQVRMKPRLSRLGYREAVVVEDCFLAESGEVLYGHEFHYSELCDISEGCHTLYELGDGRSEGYNYKNVIGGYLHLHFGKSPGALARFADMMTKAVVKS